MQDILDPERWANKTFGSCKRKDIRRTARAVKAATRMAANTSASLPAHMQTWKETIALYRLLDEKDVTCEALMQPQRRSFSCSYPFINCVEKTDLKARGFPAISAVRD